MAGPLRVARRWAADRLTPADQPARTAAELTPAAVAAGIGVPTEEIERLEVGAVDHGTSTRSRVTAHHRDGSTSSYFAKSTPLGTGARLLDAAARLCEREAHFYRHLASLVPGAPRAVIAEFDARTGRSTVLLRDLRDDGLAFSSIQQPATPDEAASVMLALADLHAAGAALPLTDPLYRYDTPGARRMAWLAARTAGRPPGHVAALVPTEVAGPAAILRERAREYAGAIGAFPHTFLHNDTHRGNIAFGAADDPRAVLVDWQGCAAGPGLKDVAYFIATGMDPADRRACERDLLSTYAGRLAAHGAEVMSPDRAWFAYRVLLVTGYVAAAVTAVFKDRLQQAENAEAGLARACAAVADHESFDALRDQMARVG